MTELFKETTPNVTPDQEVTNPLEVLVGEGKKFKDTDALARGKLESDRFVAQLQNEGAAQRTRIKQLEEELDTRTNMQAFLDEMKSLQPPELGNPPQPQAAHVQASSLNPEEISTLLDEKLQQQKRRDIAQANVTSVQQELVKTWGADYVPKLVARAQDLGLNHDFLAGIAETSPKAFLELVIPKQSNRADPVGSGPPRSGLNTGLDLSASTNRNQTYYDKLKRSDPTLYRSEKMTAQRHRDAQRLGEAFFN